MLLQKRPYDSGPNGCGAGVDKPIHGVAASAGRKNLMELVAYAIKAREDERDERVGEVAEHACGVRGRVSLECGPRRETQRVCKRGTEQQVFREMSHGDTSTSRPKSAVAPATKKFLTIEMIPE